MGKVDAALKICIADNNRYADCFNTAIGCKLLMPEKLQDIGHELLGTELGNRGYYSKHRDCVKLLNRNGFCIVACIENQSEVDYAMVARNYIYDAYSYHQQLLAIRKQHRQKKDLTSCEFLCGFSDSDRLLPVMTVCLYYGERKWDGALRLHELLDFPESSSEEYQFLKSFAGDYRLIVLDIRHMSREQLQSMESDMKQLFEILQYSDNKEDMKHYFKEHKELLSNLDEDIYNAVAALTDTEMLETLMEQARNERGGMNMCKAFEEWIADSKQEGKAEGKAEGKIEERHYSIRSLIQTLREIGINEELILDKLMLRYQLSREEGLAALQSVCPE